VAVDLLPDTELFLRPEESHLGGLATATKFSRPSDPTCEPGFPALRSGRPLLALWDENAPPENQPSLAASAVNDTVTVSTTFIEPISIE